MRFARRRSTEQELRDARLKAARANPAWTELDPVDLVPRPHGVLVSADTDWAYTHHPGTVWERGSTNLIADFAGLYFCEDDTGAPMFLERMPATWSMQVAAQARQAVS